MATDWLDIPTVFIGQGIFYSLFYLQAILNTWYAMKLYAGFITFISLQLNILLLKISRITKMKEARSQSLTPPIDATDIKITEDAFL
jgi:TRAP-type mannitol/chloroaromatic compound transport system permease large subunit